MSADDTGPSPLFDLIAVDCPTWEADEDYLRDVRALAGQEGVAVVAVVEHIDGMPLVAEPVRDPRSQGLIILDDDDSHLSA